MSFWRKEHNELKHSLSPNLLEVVFENIEWQMASVSNLWCTRLTNDLLNHFACVAVRKCFIKHFTQFKEHIEWLHKYSFLSSFFNISSFIVLWKKEMFSFWVKLISFKNNTFLGITENEKCKKESEKLHSTIQTKYENQCVCMRY